MMKNIQLNTFAVLFADLLYLHPTEIIVYI